MIDFKRSRSDPPQPGNPHGLSRRQHVFPVKSIERFQQNGGVDVYDIARNKRRFARATDVLFCADRAWSHRTETGYMKRIEDAFQKLIVIILKEVRHNFDDEQCEIISDFYALWQARAERRHLPMQYVKPAGTSEAAYRHSIDELEILEKNGYIATRPDGSMAMRDLMGPVIELNMGRIRDALGAKSWGLIEAQEGEFCIPDVPQHGIVPITPTLALVPNAPTGKVTNRNLADINHAMFKHCREYVFARDLNACPGVKS